MCMELGMHLCLPIARESSTSRGQVGYISVLLTHGRLNECSVLRSCGPLREIPVSLPCVVHPFIRQTFKVVFECPSRVLGEPCDLLTLLGACHSGEGLESWPWPQRLKPRPTVGRVYRGSFLFNCLPLP